MYVCPFRFHPACLPGLDDLIACADQIQPILVPFLTDFVRTHKLEKSPVERASLLYFGYIEFFPLRSGCENNRYPGPGQMVQLDYWVWRQNPP